MRGANNVVRATVSVLLLLLMGLVGLSHGLPAPLTGLCAQDPLQQLVSGNMDHIPGLPNYVLFEIRPYDLGRYDMCVMLPEASRYCTTYFRVMCVREDNSTEELVDANACNHGPVLGLCVPKTCPVLDLANQVANMTKEDPAYQSGLGPTSSCCADNMPSYCTSASYGYMTADCVDEQASFTSDSSAVAVFSVIVILCAASIICGAIGVYRRWAAARDVSDSESSSSRQQQADGDPASKGVYVALLSPTTVNNGNKNDTTTVAASSKFNVVQWFDLVENARDFATVKTRNVADVDTRFFEGMRTIAMLFVLFGHSLYFPSLLLFQNPIETVTYLKSYASIGVFPAELAVDVFFYLSGFLMFHLYAKYAEKRAAKERADVRHPPVQHIPMMYLRRYLRMTPVVMLTLAFAVWLANYIPSGVMRDAYGNQPMLQSCHENWWHQVLYITNMHDEAGWALCMGWFWYLSTDFQLFLLAPFLAAPYFFHRGAWFALMGALIITITGLQGVPQYGSFLGGNGSEYDKPWLRANPYIFGMVCAAVVRFPEVKAFFASRTKRWTSFFFGTVLMVSCINVMWLGMRCFEQANGGFPSSCPDRYFQFMNPYAVSAWGIGMSLIAVPWAVGFGGPIKAFLSVAPFAIASKLTFCCYMLHPIIIMIMAADGLQYPVFTPLIQYSRFCGAVLLTFSSAVLLHLVVEVPFAKMNDALTRTS